MRERIIDVATARFVARGYDGVSMREIADDCGITKAALYYHFAGKSAVLNAIFTSYLDQIAGVIQDSSLHGVGQARLRWFVTELFAVAPQRRAIMRLAMHDVGQLDPEHRAEFGLAYRSRFLTPLEELVAEGITTGEFVDKDPALVVRVLLGMLYPFFAPPNSATPEPEPVEDLLDLICFGLTGQPG
jgi:AcrR family transcriptional regulator